ncbi:PREDICTED: uncharacterized protein LOC109580618 [Amphimedon queenslandica]|uniref:MIF4G domain-containing protein n=1 Tax=Amphimedon queenslandica TaxID=400682 RepID=A0A1X7VCK0_AMPQE|nr:PREDICTED: uncharacterized protein LOC109580618 [Amphimedon queenslandica]|eukprot:XP_019849559.1 PREDICTED: uncharacterized protein LOC109580618 [Amphimedon queenslandica]
MPGRGRGRGVKGPVPNQPVLSEKQRELLQSDKPPPQQPVEDQFEDPPTKDSVNEEETSKPSSLISSEETVSPSTQNGTDDKTQDNETQDENKTENSDNPKTEPVNTSNMTTPTKTTPTETTPNDVTPSKSPSKPLNVNAPVFVPISLEQPSVGGGASLEFPGPLITELTPEDILNRFPHKSSGDVPLLLTAATMLLDASHHPATFDTHLSILCHLIEKTTPTSDILDDLVEMLVFWGIGDSTLRYTSIRMNDYLCKFSIKDLFRPKLFTKLQSRYLNQTAKKYTAGDDMSELIETTLYIAEMFYRVRLANDQVVWVLGSAALELVFKLLDIKTNETVIKACNVVKLIGYLLSYKTPRVKEFDPVVKLDAALTILRLHSVDEALSSHTSTVILSVMTLSGVRWGQGDSPFGKPKGVVPDEPVSNIEEWEEYLDDSGHVIEGEDYNEPTVFIGDQSDPNIDEELMREYEDFVQDFEEHLMMQEFGQS